jgi:hypothetical protein
MPNIVSGGSRKLVASLKLLWKGSVPPPVWQTTMTAAIPARTASALTPQETQPPENLRRIDFATEVSIRSPILTLGTNFGWRMSFSKTLVSAVAHPEATVDEGK